MCFPVRTILLVPVEGIGAIPLCLAWGCTRVPRVHFLRALAMAEDERSGCERRFDSKNHCKYQHVSHSRQKVFGYLLEINNWVA